jgi:hypothetical protein
MREMSLFVMRQARRASSAETLPALPIATNRHNRVAASVLLQARQGLFGCCPKFQIAMMNGSINWI